MAETATRLPTKDATLTRERYGGVEPADINEWWAPLSRAFLGLLWPLKGARDDLLALMAVTAPAVSVKRPSGLIAVPANGYWDSQQLQPMTHRVLGFEVLNFDTTNPLYLRTVGGQGGIQSGRLYIAPNVSYESDLNCTPQTVFILENPSGASVNAQLIVSGF
jgi:hypothetical protein